VKKVLAASTLAVLSTVASSAFAGSVEIRLGGFFPAAKSNLFTDATDNFALQSVAAMDPLQTPRGITRGDWDGLYGGAEFSERVAKNVEMGVHVDGYGRDLDTTYREFTHPGGGEISQTFRLRFVPVGVSVRFINTSRRARLSPYVSFGADAVYYRYEEIGEFVDFLDPDLGIGSDSFYSSGWLPGAHVAAGLRVPLGDDFRLSVEGKYLWTARHVMNGDRFKSEIDARGFSVTGGISVRF